MMSEIARFYGFTVSMDSQFKGNPSVLINYEDDDIQGHYDLKSDRFTDVEFPQSLLRVVKEWIADNKQALTEMWSNRNILTLPDWE